MAHVDLAMDAALLEEAQAIRRCQAGDKEAFRFIVERYGNLMYGTAYQITRNHARAQELTQDALVLAWRGINSFQGGSLKAWLVKILTNRGISLSRRREIEAATLDDPDSPVTVADESQDPAAAAVMALERERIRGAMETLPEEQRQVVTLRFFSELSVSETAVALGIREGTVKSRLSRALDRLWEALAEG
ncbi:MAG: sigma-70 family RNA polymerase sigma factor [Chloroflexota bacterium]|nr:sigma-70 family RNA polymerase sigma factor [Chloroflexota bacterium]